MSDEAIIVKVKQSITGSQPINQDMVDPMLANFFRVNQSEITNNDKAKMSEIDDYLNSITEDEMDKVMALKDIRYRLGHPKMGVSEIDHIHKYIRIRNSIKSQEAQLKAMEK